MDTRIDLKQRAFCNGDYGKRTQHAPPQTAKICIIVESACSSMCKNSCYKDTREGTWCCNNPTEEGERSMIIGFSVSVVVFFIIFGVAYFFQQKKKKELSQSQRYRLVDSQNGNANYTSPRQGGTYPMATQRVCAPPVPMSSSGRPYRSETDDEPAAMITGPTVM